MLRAGNCSSSEAGSVLLSPQSPPQPQPPRWDVSTSTTAPRHGQGGFRLHRGAWTPVALSSAPKATLSLSHGWSCPSPMDAFIPALWVTLSLPHRWPCLSPVPSPMGAPVLTLAGWSQTSPGTGDPSPGPSSGSERTGAGGWAGCQPHHGHPPPASQHQGPPPSGTRDPHTQPEQPPPQHPAPHARQGDPVTPTSTLHPGLGGGVSVGTYQLSPGLGSCCRRLPAAARSYPVYWRHTGVSPHPGTEPAPKKKSPRSCPGAAAVP